MLVMLSNSDDRYGLISKILHWSMALGIIGLIWLGWWIVDLSYYDSWYNRGLKLHRAFGMVVLILATLFMTWKIVTPSPPTSVTTPTPAPSEKPRYPSPRAKFARVRCGAAS